MMVVITQITMYTETSVVTSVFFIVRTPCCHISLRDNAKRMTKENRPNAKDFTIDILNLNSTLVPQLVELFTAYIAINSTAFEDIDSESGEKETKTRMMIPTT